MNRVNEPERPESTGTVIVAGLANLAIAAAKAVAGVLSGSAAVLSEAAHSFADTLTEVLLFVALRRGSRPADADHPFGHGKAAYLWALLAATGTLVLGAGFAVFQGVRTIMSGPTDEGHYLVAYVVLAISFVLEGTSLLRAVHQLRRGAARYMVTALRFLRRTPDTAVKAVTAEDSAALVGLVLAGARPRPDPAHRVVGPGRRGLDPDRRPARRGRDDAGAYQRVFDRGRGARAGAPGRRSGPSSSPCPT